MDPRITWSPWKPVVMKNTLPFTPLDMVNVDLLGTPRGLGVCSEVGGHVPCSGISADLINIQKNVMKKNASVNKNRIIASFVFDVMLFMCIPVDESRIESRPQ
ncbi:hypothetical protein T4E_12275 [Trichinella pseudospiralis]|uniref:Uncharacterized protein n=1 Tax=Trichinella pseudospiralis TaxID=6337 RepID=A0A0V0XFC3_TRIPS|nr:hypothetical protein T4E_12275 [Trichinella pseudospiralis]